jgi:o-succinylbenzoate---CoA ligase
MPGLVALALRGGDAFVEAVRGVWEAGDAVAVIDHRLPPESRSRALAALRPSSLVAEDGSRTALGSPGSSGLLDGDALVVTTSGSAGTPRAVVLTHRALTASATATSRRLGVDPDRHRWLACLPPVHIGGFSVLSRALCTGTPVTMIDGFDAPTVGAMGASGEATHVSLVATALGRIDPSVFEVILLGGAAPPAQLAPNVVTTYGLTETGSGVVYDGLALDGVDLAVDPTTTEILVRAPMLARATRDGAALTTSGLDGSPGWLRTGDAGALDGDRRLSVHGRLDDVIVTGGEKVWPTDVEQVLAAHPGVAEVAVWKRPDPEWGERVVAWVVPTSAEGPPTLESLQAMAREHLAPWAAPKELVVVGELPRVGPGKVARRALR